jgi:SAM-dependent methyltransferase
MNQALVHYPCVFNDLGTVQQYDKLREIAPPVLSAIGKLVCEHAIVSGLHPHILDAGAGTGRFLIPIAKEFETRSGRAVLYAVDLCRSMLTTLQSRWRPSSELVRVEYVKADLQEQLPLKEGSMHVVFTVATFHILERWREALENLVALLAPGGFFIFICENNQFMHETEGFEKDGDFPRIDARLRCFMEFYHQQRVAAGEPYKPRELRYSDMLPAVRYLAELGLVEQPVAFPPSAFEWEKPHTYADILHCFRNRQMTTWGSDLSAGARERIADALQQWVQARGIDMAKEFFLPAKLVPHVLRNEK